MCDSKEGMLERINMLSSIEQLHLVLSRKNMLFRCFSVCVCVGEFIIHWGVHLQGHIDYCAYVRRVCVCVCVCVCVWVCVAGFFVLLTNGDSP